MKNLFEFSENLINQIESSKKFKFESINNSLLRILGKGKKIIDRVELRVLISSERMFCKYGEEGIEKMELKIKKDLWYKISISVKNGLDTSISNSNNMSSFNFNSDNNGICKGYRLIKDNNLISVIKK